MATGLPLVYGFVLAHADPVWRAFQARTIGTPTAPWWALTAAFGPLAFVAAFGLRRPREDRDWMVLLWVLACAAVYFIVPEFPPHALSGLPLPLAVMAVRGWEPLRARLRVPRRIAAAAAVAMIALFTVPEAIYHGNDIRGDFRNTIVGAASRQLLRLDPNQAQAMSYIDHASRPGPVLAPWFLSMSVPGLTGRQAYAGHIMWQPSSQINQTSTFFQTTLLDPTGAQRRAILRASRAAFVIADCGSPARLARAIAPLARAVRRFGCVTVYETL